MTQLITTSQRIRVPARSERAYFILLSQTGHATRNVRLRLGTGSAVRVYGVVIGRDTAELTLNLTVEHTAPDSTSLVSLKGLATDRSRIALNGTLVIAPGAHNANARLEERALLLSPDARAHAIPNLEILAHDVQASHAATVSSLPEHELFYLATRGLAETHARSLLVAGFLQSHVAILPPSRSGATMRRRFAHLFASLNA